VATLTAKSESRDGMSACRVVKFTLGTEARISGRRDEGGQGSEKDPDRR
jgi:hypothetical protein